MSLTSEELVLIGIGVAIFLLIAALVVVRIARGMERSGGGMASAPGGGLAARLGSGRLARALNIDPATRAKRRAMAVLIALVTAGIAIGAGVFNGLKEDRELTVSEISTPTGLQGTLLSPGGKRPVVLIVPGSGPTDRNGNSPLGVGANMYAMLAQGLAEKNIASVRVDKRGMFGSNGAGDPNKVSISVYADDYRAWIDAIKAQTGVRCVWLLGHSEGALMVSAAAEGRKDVCGLILVSGMGRKMGDVIREQLKANPANAPVLPEALHAIDELEAGRHVDTTGMHPALLPLFAPQIQDYLISMFATDPVEVLRKAGKKSLIVQGTHDIQVSVDDAKLLNKAPRTRLKLIDGMNHVLKLAPEDRAGNVATYSDPALPLAPKLVSAIASFIKGDD